MTNIRAIWSRVGLGHDSGSREETAETLSTQVFDNDRDSVAMGPNAPKIDKANENMNVVGSAPPHTDNTESARRPQDTGEDTRAQSSGGGTINMINNSIAQLEEEILKIEQRIKEVTEASREEHEYRGEKGQALTKEKDRLVRREQQLREEKYRLREEKIILLRSSFRARAANDVEHEGPTKRVSFFMTSAFVDDPVGAAEEKVRLSQVERLDRERCLSMPGHGHRGDIAGTDIVANVYKIEEDNRLLARLSAFQNPIVVSTLLAGFSLVLFEVAETDLSRNLAIMSFGLEVSATMVLSLIDFHGHQLYSYASDVKPLTRKFLRRMLPLTIFALVAFSLGIVTFVICFVAEASESMGRSWMWVLGLTFSPTVTAGLLFFVSTIQVRRHSFKPPRE